MNLEQYARAVNKERYELSRASECPRDYCENEYRDYIVKKEKQY